MRSVVLLLAAVALLLALPRAARCQQLPPSPPLAQVLQDALPPLEQVLPGAPPLPALQQDLGARLQNLTNGLTDQLQKKYSFCMIDAKKDLNQTFNFSSDLSFASDCMGQTTGNMLAMLCNKAEVDLYIKSLTSSSSSSSSITPRAMLSGFLLPPWPDLHDAYYCRKGSTDEKRKLSPGRVTAIMGPSGAGKTTFLNAVLGKTSGYKKNGIVLINGIPESMQSYKKIIGFVPQDDIVHGNLTVEENLWFSSCCRLSKGTSRSDKLRVLERVIESLGLQEIRNSLVGTVEKRGLGIKVPDRENPPDYFIDILEGIVKTTIRGNATPKHLPLLWMLHNGYEVPDDFQKDLENINTIRELYTVRSISEQSSEEQTENTDSVQLNARQSNKLLERKTPGVFAQYGYYLGRVAKQRRRESAQQAVDYLILCIAGICIGTIARVRDDSFGVASYGYAIMAVCHDSLTVLTVTFSGLEPYL
nr:unnamed protein product [Digitaria exilis]